MRKFEAEIANRGGRVVSKTPHPTIRGVFQIKYQISVRDSAGNIILGQFKNKVFFKTVYEPNIFSDPQMFRWGQEAMRNITKIEGNRVTGKASNGLRFRGHLDSNGVITNFYPILPPKPTQ